MVVRKRQSLWHIAMPGAGAVHLISFGTLGTRTPCSTQPLPRRGVPDMPEARISPPTLTVLEELTECSP